MSVDKKMVKKIAHLARIALPEAKVAPMTEELNKILAFVEQLSEVDTKNARPMTSAPILGDSGFSVIDIPDALLHLPVR